jgi:hypothetical protein
MTDMEVPGCSKFKPSKFDVHQLPHFEALVGSMFVCSVKTTCLSEHEIQPMFIVEFFDVFHCCLFLLVFPTTGKMVRKESMTHFIFFSPALGKK